MKCTSTYTSYSLWCTCDTHHLLLPLLVFHLQLLRLCYQDWKPENCLWSEFGIAAISLINTDITFLCSCDPQMTSSRPWALSRVRPHLRGRAPRPVSTDPDWASTRQAQRLICPSSAPLSQGPCPVALLCSPHVRDHTPWTSLKCAPVWSPRWHAETLAVTWMSVRVLKPFADPGCRQCRCLEWLPLSVSSLSLFQLYCTGRVNGNMKSNACQLRLRRHREEGFFRTAD